jgi:cytochrome c553
VLAASAQKQTPPQKQPATSSVAFFETKIRPVLLASCVGCHGKEHPQGNLRLDVPLSQKKAKEVIVRVKGEGGKQRMPIGNPLPKEKIAALEAWVAGGAVWQGSKALEVPTLMERGKKHWAFQPRKRPHLPTFSARTFSNPIDAFIFQRLQPRGLKPSPPASRRELIRRLSYDLTGLPPTPEEVTAFQRDTNPNAYSNLVERLLASPHYGERWGRHWLDLVRYAETNSYERDNPKPHIHKYRDYVIRAFNEDKPYNQFVIEQLAGDELPNALGDSFTATAYYRLGIWDDEPADMKQAVYDDLDDIVATTGQAFLGLTLDCARCHDHKLDPIPQKDYYRFLSFFHNINRFKNGGDTDEALFFTSAEQKHEYERKVQELDNKRKENQSKIEAMEGVHSTLRAKLYHPEDLSDIEYRYYEDNLDGVPNFDKIKPTAKGKLDKHYIDLSFRKRDEKFGAVITATLNVPKEGTYTFYADADDAFRITVNGTKLIEKFGGAQGEEKKATLKLPAGKATLRVDYLQAVGPFGIALSWGGADFPRHALTLLEASAPQGLPFLKMAELPLILEKADADRYIALQKEKTELAATTVPAEKVLCVTEAGKNPQATYLLKRGDPNTQGEKVEPGYPQCAGGGEATVPTLAANLPTTGRRTALANWIASPSNPLTARVIVNRIWQHHFGRGLVRSSNDFGLQGTRPTHPELLDWLAEEFIAQGWSFKKLHRLILTSNTYKQASYSNTLALKKDPQNDLFWRFDMRRLSAEEIRDTIMAVSGNLNRTLFGKPIYPEIAKEILAGQSIPGADWHTAQMRPEEHFRRSIYIHVKRSLIYPLLATFDLPETDRPNAGRFASTQPTQALVMLNGAFVNRQAGILAERVRREAGQNSQDFAARLLALTLQKQPTPKEIAECTNLLARLQSRGLKPDQAQNYLCLMALNLNEFYYLD